ncbi:hypothetical protein [Algivirga pacifica]|uniref:Uncharacterized protein n=1 Tax=Algivirga pacifica TaxID=1162670 RepID=A0ABP9D2B6_9BACT
MPTNTHSFSLIEGDFNFEEAKEIVLHLVDYKIRFHNVKNFNDELRFGKADERSIERLKQLKKTKEALKKFFEEMEGSDNTLKIHSSIDIEVVGNDKKIKI